MGFPELGQRVDPSLRVTKESSPYSAFFACTNHLSCEEKGLLDAYARDSQDAGTLDRKGSSDTVLATVLAIAPDESPGVQPTLKADIGETPSDIRPVPRTHAEAKKSVYWPEWQEATRNEVQSLVDRKVLGPLIKLPPWAKPKGCRVVYKWKRNDPEPAA